MRRRWSRAPGGEFVAESASSDWTTPGQNGVMARSVGQEPGKWPRPWSGTYVPGMSELESWAAAVAASVFGAWLD